MGSLAAGGAAAMGTGAFTSATLADRSVSVGVAEDDMGTIALNPGDNPDITIAESGELELDLTGDEGEGVNIDSTYTWGSHNNPTDTYAFSLTNQDENTFNSVVFRYTLTDDSWITNSTTYDNQSFLNFTAYNIDGAYSTDMQAPNYALSTQNPTARNMLDPHPAEQFNPGDTWYVVVDVDTTGVDASVDDELGGSLSIEVSDPE
jgi:hypothetical protein